MANSDAPRSSCASLRAHFLARPSSEQRGRWSSLLSTSCGVIRPFCASPTRWQPAPSPGTPPLPPLRTAYAETAYRLGDFASEKRFADEAFLWLGTSVSFPSLFDWARMTLDDLRPEARALAQALSASRDLREVLRWQGD